jgi:hypothetical protein
MGTKSYNLNDETMVLSRPPVVEVNTSVADEQIIKRLHNNCDAELKAKRWSPLQKNHPFQGEATHHKCLSLPGRQE